MDPYLEERWSDVHSTLIGFVKEALQPLLPRDLRARSEERVLLESLESEEERDQAEKIYRSEVAVLDIGPRHGPATPTAAAGAVATIEPIKIELQPSPLIDRFIQIVDLSSGNRLVTAIEILSPWNKARGRLNRQYRRKLNDYADAGVSVVEIDLLRSSRGHLEVDHLDLPWNRRTPYMICIRRGDDLFHWYAYPVPLRQPLPRIPIPLRPKEPEVMLNLQPLIERVYVAGGHDDIDYSRPPKPLLEGEDAAWAADLLKSVAPRQ
jgi:hypothetical protein